MITYPIIYGSGGGTERKTTANLGYVSNDIYYHYDGEYNLGGYPHESNMVTNWIDLNGNGGQRVSGVIGDNYYQTGGDTNTLIKLPVISEIMNQITFELTFEWIEISGSGEQDSCSNFDDAGFGFSVEPPSTLKNTATIRIINQYKSISSNQTTVINKKYCLQCSYNGSKMVFFENGTKVGELAVNGGVTPSSTLFGIGGAGKGTYCSKIKCYSFRMYNRGLTDSELAQNFAVDCTRFEIT